jgi:hypothetical protein
MGPCIVSIFQYISNKMQRHTVYLYLETALHISGCTSTHHQEHIQLSTASNICHTVTATCRYKHCVEPWFHTVQQTHTDKDLITYAASPPD